jgi:ADP-heptose:LPS heptosyltransferase
MFHRYARLLECTGREDPPARLRMAPSPATCRELDEILRDRLPSRDVPLAVMHPGAGYDFRRWPEERFAAVADGLAERWGVHTCLVGGPAEAGLMDRVRQTMRRPDHAVCLRLSLTHLVALFERAALLVSNESGPTHLATTTDVPIVTIFGPAKESRWRPVRDHDVTVLRGADCDPACRWQSCAVGLRCLLATTADDVLSAAEPYLQRLS